MWLCSGDIFPVDFVARLCGTVGSVGIGLRPLGKRAFSARLKGTLSI